MSLKVVVIDYGCSNLLNLVHALEYCGAQVKISNEASIITFADRVLLPGVGAFSYGIHGLCAGGLDEAIKLFASSGRPLLGICLGMQMLASISEEFGSHRGLDLISGRVVPIPTVDICGMKQKIPYIGWCDLQSANDWAHTPLASTNIGASVYLVHSYQMIPDNSNERIAFCNYGGHAVTVAVRKNNLFGFQFHPEKSGQVGLAILSEFLAM